MLQQVSCLVLRDVVPRCVVLQEHVVHVVSRADWTGGDRLHVLEEIGVHVPPGIDSERVLVLRTDRGQRPLLVRGRMVSKAFAPELLSRLSERAYARSAFSGAIIRDATIDALLLDPNRLFASLEP